MVLAQELRNALRRSVQQVRGILTDDLTETLEATYGIHRDGRFETIGPGLPALKDERERETRDLLERILPASPTTKAEKLQFEESFDAVLRSLAFTHLNRLVAFKLMEDPSRKILKQTVGRGPESRAFIFYLGDRPAEEALCKTGRQDEAYRRFLLWQCAQLDKEIGILFDPGDVASRVFPRPPALKEVLENLNAPELAPIWAHEEAIGWVYQYYTPKELREKARKDSAAPRNSYEMAFRNQFYTPEYVVRFLVDNTLGRIWYEMQRGETALKDHCEYLTLRQEEEPNGRPKKDPRAIRVLDPACGSGHFLVYAFVLFETIYREAYEDAALGPALRREWPDRTAYEKAIPKLILENNLYGIDIDRRAVQLAALTLFLKARSASPEVRIDKSRIVCAEPMPGERGLFEEFKQRELPKLTSGQAVVGRILDALRDHVSLAAEAGSLLQAERELERLVIKEHAAWRQQRKPGSIDFLFPEMRKPTQSTLDFEDVTDEEFWQGLETKVGRLFEEYAQEVTGAEGAHRRLFARDGAEALRFLDTLRYRYDVVLMNPPFGDPSLPSKEYLDATYPRTRNDVYAAFVERWLGRLLESGRLGAITSRTGFFLKTFSRWREDVLLQESQVDVIADLGAGVLDTAMVETAAYVLGKGRIVSADETLVLRLSGEDQKDARLLAAILALRTGAHDPLVYRVDQRTFRMIPGSPFAYWVSASLRRKFSELPQLEGNVGAVRQGLATADDFRFVRAAWEVPRSRVARDRDDTHSGKPWVPFVKGGDYVPFYADVHLVVNWEMEGSAIRTNVNERGSVRSNVWMLRETDKRYFFRPGLTFPRRTHRIAPRVLPAGAIFSHGGQAAFPAEGVSPAALVALLSSTAFFYLLKTVLPREEVEPQYEVGEVRSIPVPVLGLENLAGPATRAIDALRRCKATDEVSPVFRLPTLLQTIGSTANERLVEWNRASAEAVSCVQTAQRQIDRACYELYGIDADDQTTIETALDVRIRGLPEPISGAQAAADLVSWMVGVVFGRFDVRLATGDRAIPELPDPFAPLSATSPGVLPEGWPPPPGYPIPIDDDGILVDDEPHTDDVVRRVRDVFQLLWGNQADQFEKEMCALLGTKTLRDYFAKTGKGGFWNDHFRRYSKSRRRAPIYWLLQSPRGLCRIWIYAQRLTRDTLPKLLGQRYLSGALAGVKHAIEELRPAGQTRPDLTKKQEGRLAELDELLVDLEEFTALIRAATARTNDRGETVGYAPDPNDGVVLAAAPLHGLIPWPRTRKHSGRTASELQAYWEELEQGEYDWANVAMVYWPTRVTEKCRTDKSLALAHGLDAEFFPGVRQELLRKVEAPAATDDADNEAEPTDDEQDEE